MTARRSLAGRAGRAAQGVLALLVELGAGTVAAVRGLLARPLASYYLLVASAGLLLVIGLAMVFSATSVEELVASGNAYSSVEGQAIWAAVGLVMFWLCQRTPVRTYRALARPLLLTGLIAVMLLDLLSFLASRGVIARAAIGPLTVANQLWFSIGTLSVQPAELTKIALVLWVADVLVRKGERAGAWRDLARPLFPVAILLFALVGVNDLGTMACLVVLFVAMLWAAGVQGRVFAGLGVLGVLGALALIVAPGHAYRLTRISAYLHPDADPLNAGYQVREGYFAIANGGWLGVGIGEGRLKWGYLPNGHNDFIFAVIAEELGVVGCLGVLALFAILGYAGLRIARRCTNPFRRYAAAGVTCLIIGEAAINIGGVLGLLPVTGLPLPLISDGGSALVVTLAMIGMLASFARAEPAAAQALHARPVGRLARLLWAPLPPLPVRRPRQPDWEEGPEDG